MITNLTMDTPASDEHLLPETTINILIKKKQLFCSKINKNKIPVLLTLLEASDCLVKCDVENIKAEKTPHEQLSCLVDCLVCGTQGQLVSFLKALRDDSIGCTALAKLFETELETESRSQQVEANAVTCELKDKDENRNLCKLDTEIHAELEWPIYDLVMLRCAKISGETLHLLCERKINSLDDLNILSDNELSELLRNPPFNAFQITALINLLNESNDLESCLNTGKIAMSNTHMEKLSQNIDKLIKIIKYDKLRNRLKAYNVIENDDDFELEKHGTTSGQARYLLDNILPTKPDIAFGLFLQALRDIGQGYVAYTLEMDQEKLPEVDCWLEVKLNLRKTGSDGKITPEYLQLVQKFTALKSNLFQALSQKDSPKRKDILRKLSIIETYQNRIVTICPGSIYIGITSPDEESLLDLMMTHKSGRLSKIIKHSLDIDGTQSEFPPAEVEMTIKIDITQTMCSWPVACLESSMLDVESLIAQNINMYEVDRIGRSALHWACAYSSLEIVKYLIAEGADICARDYDGQTILMSACQDKCPDKVRYLVKTGHDVNDEDYNGVTALHMAAAFSSLEVLEFLIGVGGYLVVSKVDCLLRMNLVNMLQARQYRHIATPVYELVLPLHLACAFNTLDVVTYLMERTRNYNMSELLWMSCFDADLEKVKFLHVRGGSVNTYVSNNLRSNKAESVTLLRYKYMRYVTATWNSYKPIHVAVEFSCLSVIKFLLEHGADLNEVGRGYGHPLSFACRDNDIDKVDFLLSHGYDVNLVDKHDFTYFLCDAAEFSSPQILELLVQQGADINWKNGGRSVFSSAALSRYTTNLQFCLQHGLDINKTYPSLDIALHDCAELGTVSNMEYLLKAGADINVIFRNGGKTILHAACKSRSLDKVKLCIRHGLDVKRPDSNGDTPLHYAAKLGTAEMVEYLIQAGADVKALNNAGESILQTACTSKSVRKIKLIKESMDKTLHGDTSSRAMNTVALKAAMYSYPAFIYLWLTSPAQITLDDSTMDDDKTVSLIYWSALLGINPSVDIVQYLNCFLNEFNEMHREIWLSFSANLEVDRVIHKGIGYVNSETYFVMIYVSNPLFVRNKNDEILAALQQQKYPDPFLLHTVKQRRDQVPTLYKLTRACIRRCLPSNLNMFQSYRLIKDIGIPQLALHYIFMYEEIILIFPRLSPIITLFFNVLELGQMETPQIFDITKADGQEALDYRHAVLRLMYKTFTYQRFMPLHYSTLADEFERELENLLKGFCEIISKDTNFILTITGAIIGSKQDQTKHKYSIIVHSDDIHISKSGVRYFITHSIHDLKGVMLSMQTYIHKRLMTYLYSTLFTDFNSAVDELQFMVGNQGDLRCQIGDKLVFVIGLVFRSSKRLIDVADSLTGPFSSSQFGAIRDKIEKSYAEFVPSSNTDIETSDDQITSEWELSFASVDDIILDFMNTISPRIKKVFLYTKFITDSILPRWTHNLTFFEARTDWDRSVLNDRVLLNLVLWEVKEHPDSWEKDNLTARVTSLLNSLSTWKYTDVVTGKIQDSLCVDYLSETSRNNLQREMSDDLNSVKQVLSKQTTDFENVSGFSGWSHKKIYIHFNYTNDNLEFRNMRPWTQDVLYYKEQVKPAHDVKQNSDDEVDIHSELVRLVECKISKQQEQDDFTFTTYELL